MEKKHGFVLHGIRINNKKQEVEYVGGGLKEGKWIYWHFNNGKIKEEGEYIQNNLKLGDMGYVDMIMVKRAMKGIILKG